MKTSHIKSFYLLLLFFLIKISVNVSRNLCRVITATNILTTVMMMPTARIQKGHSTARVTMVTLEMESFVSVTKNLTFKFCVADVEEVIFKLFKLLSFKLFPLLFLT